MELSAFQRDVLAVISGMDAPNGLTIKSVLEETSEIEVNHGRLYPNLDDMVEAGLIEKGEVDGRTNYYELTEEGEREVEAQIEWLDAISSGAMR